MFNSNNQIEFRQELDQMIKDQVEKYSTYSYCTGYLESTCIEMLALLPKRKQKEFVARIARLNGDTTVKVKNVLSGIECEIPRRDLGTCNDPSMELYHTM